MDWEHDRWTFRRNCSNENDGSFRDLFAKTGLSGLSDIPDIRLNDGVSVRLSVRGLMDGALERWTRGLSRYT